MDYRHQTCVLRFGDKCLWSTEAYCFPSNNNFQNKKFKEASFHIKISRICIFCGVGHYYYIHLYVFIHIHTNNQKTTWASQTSTMWVLGISVQVMRFHSKHLLLSEPSHCCQRSVFNSINNGKKANEFTEFKLLKINKWNKVRYQVAILACQQSNHPNLITSPVWRLHPESPRYSVPPTYTQNNK